MLQILTARDGSPTLRIGEVYLHSSYSPQREVERFLDQFDFSQSEALILCGETLGYLYKEIQNRYPGLKLICIFYTAPSPDFFLPEEGAYWHPGSQESLSDFLHRSFSVLGGIGTDIFSWPAAEKAFPEVSRKLLNEIRQFLREISGSLSVFRVFGKKWLRNFFFNFLSIEKLFFFDSLPQKPAVIAASGPSLEEALPFLREYRRDFFLIALPSSLGALKAGEIKPDLFLQTDPGYYASRHVGQLREHQTEIAMPLTASRGAEKTGHPVGVFSQGSFLEKALEARLGRPLFTIPSTGTVMAAALLAVQTQNPHVPVICAGFDLCSRDVISHARPHIFDDFSGAAAGRRQPLLSLLYNRALQGAENITPKEAKPETPHSSHWQSLPMKTYQGWFNRQRPGPAPLYRLFPSPARLDGFREIDEHQAGALLKNFRQEKAARRPRENTDLPFPPLLERKALASGLLDTWIDLTKAIGQNLQRYTPESFFREPIIEEFYLPLAFLETIDFKKASLEKGSNFSKLAGDYLGSVNDRLIRLKGDFRL